MKTYRDIYPMGRKFCSKCGKWRLVAEFSVRKWADEPICEIPRTLHSLCRKCDTIIKRIKQGCEARVLYAYGAIGSGPWREHQRARNRKAQTRRREDPAYRAQINEYYRIWHNAKTNALARVTSLEDPDPQVDPIPLAEWLAELNITQRELSNRSEMSERFFSAPRAHILISQVDQICIKLGYPEMVSILYESA